jgi:ABC-2 type transport system ATP-binding protein
MTVWGLESVVVRLGGGPAALDGVSLRVSPGEVAVVVGGDGAGKTTLARTLVGLESPSSGRVRRPDGRRVGYQPEGSGVWPDLTVEENLAFVAAAFRIGRAETAERISEMLAATGLGAARNRLGVELSGGMRQKLGVAMALMAGPEMVVLDEPTTGVDPVSRFELWRLVSRSAADGTAVVMTTTYLDEAERAGTIVALDSGRMLAAGTPDELRASVPGAVFEVERPTESTHQWRRGSSLRLWTDGSPPPGATRIDPDLADVLVAASFAAETTG